MNTKWRSPDQQALRDEFAGRAMQAILSNGSQMEEINMGVKMGNGENTRSQLIAIIAYSVADSMMAQRYEDQKS